MLFLSKKGLNICENYKLFFLGLKELCGLTIDGNDVLTPNLYDSLDDVLMDHLHDDLEDTEERLGYGCYGYGYRGGLVYGPAGVYFGLNKKSNGFFISKDRHKEIKKYFNLSNKEYSKFNQKIYSFCQLDDDKFLFF